MKKELIKEAASIEEAKRLIAEELGVAEDAVTYEVMQEPEKKVLGLFGGTDAIVKGTANVTGNASAAAKAYLEQVLAGMGVDGFTISVTEQDNGCVITLDGENLGFIIGRRGETLDALQYLTSLVANRADNAYYRVTLDIGNYREKREQALVALARRLGGQTARTGRRNSLEPMNPYERRIIHTTVQDMEGVISWSVGTDPNRHVVIGPSDDNPNKDRANERSGRSSRGGRGRSRGNGGNGGNRGERSERRPRRDDNYQVTAPERPVREFISRSNPLPVAEDFAPTRTTSEKEESASLYGRIDL
ncbi:MAG: protein jag [Clostridia bacterium]|nr:protein jag [Clostridia bacterium]